MAKKQTTKKTTVKKPAAKKPAAKKTTAKKTAPKKQKPKVSPGFRKAIQDRMDAEAKKDPLFAKRLKKRGKNMDDCLTYILNTVKASGIMGFEDDEIFNMAIHYYTEDKIDIGKPFDAKVVVNHQVQLTEKEKEEAKEKAIREVMDEQKANLKKKPEKKKKKEDTVQGSLF